MPHKAASVCQNESERRTPHRTPPSFLTSTPSCTRDTPRSLGFTSRSSSLSSAAPFNACRCVSSVRFDAPRPQPRPPCPAPAPPTISGARRVPSSACRPLVPQGLGGLSLLLPPDPLRCSTLCSPGNGSFKRCVSLVGFDYSDFHLPPVCTVAVTHAAVYQTGHGSGADMAQQFLRPATTGDFRARRGFADVQMLATEASWKARSYSSTTSSGLYHAVTVGFVHRSPSSLAAVAASAGICCPHRCL